MKYLLPEVDNNADAFSERFPREMADACAYGLKNTEGFRDAYRRVVSLQAWRVLLFERQYPSSGVISLFLEAQNDALLSVVLAHTAMWRPALQLLRSCIENILNTCYYVDHTVEFRLWETGKHRNDFSALVSYFSSHPDGVSPNELPNSLAHLRSEYATLSKAVHASAKAFLMSKEGDIRVTRKSDIDYNQWSTRHSNVLLWLNLFLVCLNSSALEGAQNRDLRKSISLAIPSGYHSLIFKHLRVRLFAMS